MAGELAQERMLVRMVFRQSPHPERTKILRRLADAEVRVVELGRENAELRNFLVSSDAWASADRGEPDFLIGSDGDMFDRVAPGTYHLRGGGGANWTRDEVGDAQEFWK